MWRLLFIALLPLASAACGGEPAAAPPAASVEAPRVEGTRVQQCEPGVRTVGGETIAYAAVVREHATVYRAPARRAFARFEAENVNDYPTVFGVRAERVLRDCSVRWYRVQIPLRPNGVTGWVRAAEVDVQPVRTRIEIDLSERRLELYRAGRRVLATTVAVGAPATPTPTGSFYVNQRLIPEDATGPFGPAALGVSAYSDVLTGWAQGGPIGIHGTNAPSSIGRDVSNGCIRVPNGTLERLFAAAFAGTPVLIRP